MQGQLHIVPPPTKKVQKKNVPARSSRRLLWAVVAIVAAIGILAIIAAHNWPFTRDAIVQDLQEESGGDVQLAGFRPTYFPHPGCVAEGVTIRRNGDQASPPFITMRRLTVTGSYPGLFARRVEQIRAEEMHVLIRHGAGSPASLGPGMPGVSAKSKAAIGEIIADGAQVEIDSQTPGQQPLLFLVQKLAIHSVAEGRPLLFRAVLKLPDPPGDLSVTGQLGPWKPGDFGQTPLSGSYTLEHADLGVFNGIGGTLSSTGKFSGVLQHVEMSGKTDVPDFEVTSAKHGVHLSTDFRAVVNGLNGDVVLDPVTAHWGRTTIVAKVNIAGSPEGGGKGKTVTLSAYSSGARTEDLLRLFTKSNPPPMTGDIVFRAKVAVPPEERPFLDKLRLQGDFGIAGGQYTKFETQKSVDLMSARARGQADKVEDRQEKEKKEGNDNYDPGRVLSNVKGRVVLRNGVANLTDVSFDVPGASAVVSGTYNLKSQRVNLHGPVRLDAPLSKATTGVKSFLMKIVQPLVQKKKQKGSTVEVRVAGTYNDPSFIVVPIPPK